MIRSYVAKTFKKFTMTPEKQLEAAIALKK
jgi:hypothetical protein